MWGVSLVLSYCIQQGTTVVYGHKGDYPVGLAVAQHWHYYDMNKLGILYKHQHD